jgi:hypothetical protein
MLNLQHISEFFLTFCRVRAIPKKVSFDWCETKSKIVHWFQGSKIN